jgi:dienelactone hydrolase
LEDALPDQCHDSLSGFDNFLYPKDNAIDSQRYCVYHAGEGPSVVLLHELPGMSPECVSFARFLVASGFKVYLPLFFGRPNRTSALNGIRVCVRREFALFLGETSSPVSNWLRAFCSYLAKSNPDVRIAVIGLCLTGGYVFACSAEPAVLGLVASEPAVPIPITKAKRAQISASSEELSIAKASGIPILALRFENDWICPQERFDRLSAFFGSAWTEIVLNPPPGSPRAHSVLTVERTHHSTREIESAVEQVVAYLKRQLRTVTKLP